MKRSRGEIVGSALVAAFVVGVVFATAVSVSVTAAERGAAGGGVVERGWSDWEYSKSVLVKENSGATLNDYQVLLNLSGEDFPAEAKTDGSDLRFVDAEEEEELSYWVEKFDAANETGRVWVKVPEIPADGEAELKMLYGNPSAESVSNFSATMLLPPEVLWHTTTAYEYFINTVDVDSNDNIYAGVYKAYHDYAHLVKFDPKGTEKQSLSMYSNILSIKIDDNDKIFVSNGPWGKGLRVYNTDLSEQCHTGEYGDYRENLWPMKLSDGYLYAPSTRSSSPPYNTGITKFDTSCNVIETTTYHSSQSSYAGGVYHHSATDKTYAGFRRADDNNYLRLARFTGASSLDWDKLVLADSHASIQDIIYKDGYLYISGTGKRDEIGTNAYIFLGKYDLDGNLIWMRNYTDVSDYATTGETLMRIGDNLLLMPANYYNGSYCFAAFYAVDFDGNLIWRGYINSIFTPDNKYHRKIYSAKLLDDKKILLGGRDGDYGDLMKVSYYKQVFPEPTVTIEPDEDPTVSIETDEFEYSAGDTMNVEIEVENPTEDRLALEWWWLVPEYSVCVGLTAMPLSVPAGYDETLEYSFAVPELGAKWFSNAFFVQLAETEAGGGEGAGGEVLDADAACWIYRPAGRGVEAAQTAVGEAEVEIADEIRRAVEGVK